MYTAKLINKNELPDGRLEVTVEYTDGVDTHIETFVPQDKQGYKYRVESMKTSLTTAKELKEEDNVGKAIEPEEVVDTRTKAEKDRDEWIVKYYRWVRIKNDLIDTGVLTGDEQAVTDYLADVKAGFKPAYVNFL